MEKQAETDLNGGDRPVPFQLNEFLSMHIPFQLNEMVYA